MAQCSESNSTTSLDALAIGHLRSSGRLSCSKIICTHVGLNHVRQIQNGATNLRKIWITLDKPSLLKGKQRTLSKSLLSELDLTTHQAF